MRSAGPEGVLDKVKGCSGIWAGEAHPVITVAIAPPEAFRKSLLDIGICFLPFLFQLKKAYYRDLCADRISDIL
jgi:hypothetical protein